MSVVRPSISCSCGVSWVGFDNRRLLAHLRDHLALQHTAASTETTPETTTASETETDETEEDE